MEDLRADTLRVTGSICKFGMSRFSSLVPTIFFQDSQLKIPLFFNKLENLYELPTNFKQKRSLSLNMLRVQPSNIPHSFRLKNFSNL